eukprot:scaffold345_cov134-Cylindrotheca_fusiformis.AAC.61
MKRALAERAKQSGLPNGVGPASPSPEFPISSNDRSEGPSSGSNGHAPVPSSSSAPMKIHSSSTTSSKPPSASPRPKKRLRESSAKLDDEEEDDSNASAFFLRHQNRALASELRMLKYQLQRLERERDYRRSQSSKAVQTLNSLQATWTQMEAALQSGQLPPPADNDDLSGGSMEAGGHPNGARASTGSGSSVELIGALLDSLAALGATTPSKRKGRIREEGEDDDSSSTSEYQGTTPREFMEEGDARQLDDLLRITDNVSKRAATLQRWIWSLLQRVKSSAGEGHSGANDSVVRLQQQVAKLKAKNKTLKAQLKEVATSRDEMTNSDKRVRRGLYRLAAGRVQLKEVLKAIVVSDEDKEAAAAWMESTPVVPATTTSAPTTSSAPTAERGNGDKSSPEDAAQIVTLTKQVADLEEVAQARDEQIRKLLSEREEQIKKINSLALKGDEKDSAVPTEQQIRQSDLFAELSVKVASSERNAKLAEEKLSKVKQEWGQAVADAKAARSAMEEMHEKHMKKWKDFSEENPEGSGDGDDETTTRQKKAEEIIALQHKLTQALENVRQAETTRQTLEEAVTINQTLQAKLDEVKSKYAALQASRSTGSSGNNHTSSSSTAASSSGGPTTPKPKHSSSSSATGSSQPTEKLDKSEKEMLKLHRDYRKVRKELAAVAASREAAKAKLAASEREKETLSQSHARLLKQASERDDVNAKSLSTILHLKQLTEQITKEKENLEQQVKSSQQVALAARLAANARERVSEEFEKARKDLALQITQWEQRCVEAAKEKDALEIKLTQQRERMATLMKDAENAKRRCDELASESTKIQEERQRMMESLAVAKRQASEAAEVSQSMAEKSSFRGEMPSGFTVDQLNTQVTVLKSRLSCPVCNHRDKNCILLRCRHMFCKQCVDENVKNRSRKCPACGQRFDTKDVGDVWL